MKKSTKVLGLLALGTIVVGAVAYGVHKVKEADECEPFGNDMDEDDFEDSFDEDFYDSDDDFFDDSEDVYVEDEYVEEDDYDFDDYSEECDEFNTDYPSETGVADTSDFKEVEYSSEEHLDDTNASFDYSDAESVSEVTDSEIEEAQDENSESKVEPVSISVVENNPNKEKLQEETLFIKECGVSREDVINELVDVTGKTREYYESLSAPRLIAACMFERSNYEK